MARGSWSAPAAGQQAVDDPGAAGRAVVPLPLRPAGERAAGRRDLVAERGLPGQVVRAVRVATEIGQGAVAVFPDQVPGQLPHAALVVAAHVRGGRRGHAGQGHHRDLPGQPFQLIGVEHLVVQDQAVTLAGQREDPPGVIMIVHVHRADQQVVVAVLGGQLDTPVDQVRELEALFLVLEDVVAERLGGRRPPDHHPDDLLEPGAQRPRRPVRDEAQLGDGVQDAFAGLGHRVAAAVEHPGDRGDRHPGGAGHVVDGRRGDRGAAPSLAQPPDLRVTLGRETIGARHAIAARRAHPPGRPRRTRRWPYRDYPPERSLAVLGPGHCPRTGPWTGTAHSRR